MLGKNKKTVFFNFLPYECEAAEEYLEAMAEKGWLLQSVSGAFLKFKKIEPQKIKYAVDVFHKLSEFDHKDSNIALEYREYCQKAGWKYICQKGKIQIFYTEDYENTLPIHTDEEEKLKSVIKASLSNMGSQLFLTLLLVFNLYLQLFMGSPQYALSTNLGVISTLALASAVFINIVEILSFILWAVRARAHLNYNEFMPYNNSRQVRTKNMLKLIYAGALLLLFMLSQLLNNQEARVSNIFLVFIIMLIPLTVFVLTKSYINNKRYSRKANEALYAVSVVLSFFLLMGFTGAMVLRNAIGTEVSAVSTEKVPLTLKDFGTVTSSGSDIYLQTDKSILASRIDYSCDGLAYTVFESPYPFIVKFDGNREVLRFIKYGFDFKKINSKLPSDIKVYANDKHETFILVSNNKVVNIRKQINNVEEDKFLEIAYSKLFN